MFDPFEDKGKIYTKVVTKSPVKVILQTATNRIVGLMHVRPGDRLKDALVTSDHFLAVTDARIYDVNGTQLIYHTNFIAVNLHQILWVSPEEELLTGE
ncbi:MAG: DUF6812 domain-containing protein [Bellilinea sp.]